MKKIDKHRAIELLQLGIFPKCLTSREVYVPVKSIAELNKLEQLSSVQSFVLYGYEDNEILSFKVPEDAIELDIDEASLWLTDYSNYVFVKVIGTPEKKMYFAEFVNFLRENKNNTSFLIYWYENE